MGEAIPVSGRMLTEHEAATLEIDPWAAVYVEPPEFCQELDWELWKCTKCFPLRGNPKVKREGSQFVTKFNETERKVAGYSVYLCTEGCTSEATGKQMPTLHALWRPRWGG